MRIGGPFESPTPSLKPIAQQQPSYPLSRALPSAKHQSGRFGSRRPVNCTRSQGPRADHFAGRRGGCSNRAAQNFPFGSPSHTPKRSQGEQCAVRLHTLRRPCPSPTSRNVDVLNCISNKNHCQPGRHQPIAPPPPIPYPTPQTNRNPTPKCLPNATSNSPPSSPIPSNTTPRSFPPRLPLPPQHPKTNLPLPQPDPLQPPIPHRLALRRRRRHPRSRVL